MTKIICVDLDGTLIYNDVFAITAKRFVRMSLFNSFRMILWVFRGVAYLKYKISEQVDINPEDFSYNDALIEYLQKKKNAGCQIFLATGCTRLYADKIAEQLGIFDGVFASDAHTNLVGRTKADRLSREFGEFAYAGNSLDDVFVWEKATEAIVVNPDVGVLDKMRNRPYELLR